MSLAIRRANAEDCGALTDICFRSKQSNGYDDIFMESCRAELIVNSETLAKMRVWVAQDGDALLGCVGLETLSAEQGEVSLFFVDPKFQSRSVGRMLWTVVFKTAHELGLSSLVLDADPAAVGFYAKLGFTEIGKSPSGSIEGRVLPKMQLFL